MIFQCTCDKIKANKINNALPIDPNREEDRAKYTADALHFNDAGHHIIAQPLKDFLEQL